MCCGYFCKSQGFKLGQKLKFTLLSTHLLNTHVLLHEKHFDDKLTCTQDTKFNFLYK